MKICVLQPDYTGSSVDYARFDPHRDLAPWLPGDTVDHVYLRKATVYRQLREASRAGYDVFVNLCEGYLDWDIPSIDVIWTLDRLGLPYTGAPARLYDPSKPLMKYVAHVQGVRSPAFVLVTQVGEEPDLGALRFPLFAKPPHAGDSLGIDEGSRVETLSALRARCDSLVQAHGGALVEDYVAGREFTVLVAASPRDPLQPVALKPLEFVFTGPERFKTYDLKVTQHHPARNVPVTDPDLDARLRDAACRVFTGFSGEGYARLDFRMDAHGEIWFLDVNFACSVFYPEGHEGSADYILQHDPIGVAGFLRHIVEEGIARHQRTRPRYERRANARHGFGIHATGPIVRGEVVFRGEERAQRLVTRAYTTRAWTPAARELARRYAYPVDREVLLLWDEDPDAWAPQNHACDPNTEFVGLDLVARRDIAPGEELTVDYGALYDETMTPFDCVCGTAACRGHVVGTPGNSVSARVQQAQGSGPAGRGSSHG